MIEVVRSLDDERIADYAHVADPAWLRARGLFVAEGRLVVRRLVESGRFPVHSLLLTPAALEALADVIRSGAGPVWVCEQHILDGVTGVNFHRGCLALAERPRSQPALETFVPAARLLLLEGVVNPDNVGGMFRVAAAFGAGGILLDRSSSDPLYRKAIRTSMGAVLRMPFAIVPDAAGAAGWLLDNGFAVVALTPDPAAMPLAQYAATLPAGRRVALMLGAEGDGLSAAAFSMATVRVRIPTTVDVDSLNVVVAAGIALARLAEG